MELLDFGYGKEYFLGKQSTYRPFLYAADL